MSRFDEIYAQSPDHFGTEPSEILGRFHGAIRPGGRVLDIGVGQGRNAVFLARLGFEIEGIDTSEIGLRIVRERAAAEGFPIELHRGDILTFSPGRAFAAVLALGIIPLLGHEDVDLLFDRIDDWTAPGGLVFVSAFTVQDRRYGESSESWESLGRNTFRNGGRLRTFLEPDEILTLLPGYGTEHHWEGLAQEHRHGDGPPERHHMAYLVARRPVAS